MTCSLFTRLATRLLIVLAGGVFVATVAGSGCSKSGVGDPCIPESEYQTDFKGFDFKQVVVESRSFQCQTRTCLVNHFRGRVSCKYGQKENGEPLFPDQASCTVPGTTTPLKINDPQTDNRVEPQCVDRTADKAVYCSCRCQNSDKRTDDGAVYCECPDGFTCTQVVSNIPGSDRQLSGGYCVKEDTNFDPANACTRDCDPKNKACGG